MTGLGPALLQSDPTLYPWSWTLSRVEQYLMSAALLAFFVAATTVIYAAGSPLKRRVDDKEIVEAMQSLSVTVVGLVVSVGLVVVWRLRNELLHAFTFIKIGPADGVRALVVAATFAAAFTVTRITKRAIRRGSEADTITAHQKEVAHHVVQLLVFAPAVLFVLALYGVNPGNLLLGAGAAGLLVGLAARHTLGAIVAGFVLLISRPFEVNDWVVIDDEEGVVTDISIFNTEIRTFDNEIVIIPNDEVTKNNTINRSRNGKLRIQVDVGVDYDVEVARAMELAREAMHVLDEVLDEPAPDVVVDKFGSSSVVLTLRFWIPDPSVERKWAAQNAVIDAVKEAFEEAGVKIPYPQRELMGREETDGFRLAGDLGGRGDGKDDGDPRSAVTPASSVDGDGPGTHMSAVTDPTMAIDTDPDEAPDPRSTEGEYVSVVERVEDRELSTPVEPMDREDD